MSERRTLGSLSAVDGRGAVRMEDRFDADIDDVWSALTQPPRLARWLGEVAGDLEVGGTYTFHFTASGAEGTGRVEECEPPRRFLLRHGVERQDAQTIEATLHEDGDQTVVVIEERGMPLGLLAGYGAGIQIHIEDLGAHLAGREPDGDSNARWDDLEPLYRPLAEEVGT
ncbi:MAG TPA: SRPBCC family protein [Nocardioides sp.]|nr:SRPBCC family protein [Nocardioides sp.]